MNERIHSTRLRRVQFGVTAVAICIGGSSSRAAATIYDLGTLGGAESRGRGVNDAGQVVGSSYTSAGWQRAFLYSGMPGNGGTMSDLGTLGWMESIGYAINASGQIAGNSYTSPSINLHAFRYTGTPGSGERWSIWAPLVARRATRGR